MVIKVDALGDACPIPVIKTKNALQELKGPGTVETLVDNETAVKNLTKLAGSQGCSVRSEKIAPGQFRVVIEAGENAQSSEKEIPEELMKECPAEPPKRKKKIVVAVTSAGMGSGSDELAAVLMKGFLFALTQQEQLPDTILLYNGGARLTTGGSASLEDLKNLEAQGVEILTCGTCLNFYKLSDQLRVGGVTNMYEITERLTGADLVIRP